MAAPQDVSMAPGLEIVSQFVVRVTAIDATTGNTVSGVTVSNVVITGQDLTGGGGAATMSAPEPLFLPLPAGQLE